MDSICVNVACSIVASVICDVSKWGIGKFQYRKSKINEKEIEEYVMERLDNKFDIICDSSIFNDYIHSPVVSDTINNYILYKITGKFERNIAEIKNIKKNKEQNILEEDIVEYLTKNLLLRYSENDIFVSPNDNLVAEFFELLFDMASEFIFKKMNVDDRVLAYAINTRIDCVGDNLLLKMHEMMNVLSKSTKLEIIDWDKEFIEIKDDYLKILKDNNSKAHIYLLNTFNFCEFYVPPILRTVGENDIRTEKLMFIRNREKNKNSKKNDIDIDEAFDDWKYIFDKNNIVYITGGAGYGKSLFMKKIINNYVNLNIVNSQEYLVIYGELKSFYQNNSENPVSMTDFLQLSMVNETLMDNNILSHKLIEYYLKAGRCIILLDALDEVEKSKRKSLHKKVITYFKNQNPNNKICITSRNRGFIPEKEIEVFDIAPLDRMQIELYVDKIIELGEFDSKDKNAFLEQTNVLVEKKFLNSFLVLSLLINIYKAERELPENKLDLYQKCFEYIANRREKEKTECKYNWKFISPVMKDNTFMELANMCLPNNSDVDKEDIKIRLSEVYKSKYSSEGETESAIDEFLEFCSDRTELFVPSSSEDKFKFFHRSFFEYFYSQYIFQRYHDVKEVYDKLMQFDVDSEVFELTIAMMKQKSEYRYQELIEYIFDKMGEEIELGSSKCHALNILILGMQVIDDELYKKRLIQFLVDNSNIMIKNKSTIDNEHILISVINSNNVYVKQINEAYEDYNTFYTLQLFSEDFATIDKMSKEILSEKKEKINTSDITNLHYRYYVRYRDTFYMYVYFSSKKLSNLFSWLDINTINEICNKYKARKKDIEKIKRTFRKYLELEEKQKQIFDKILFGLTTIKN